ncbi:MAG: DUF5985 family protein [Phycisphaerae bacterium]
MLGEAVYILCLISSFACVVLLGRAYLRNRARILLWSLICFILLTINNVLLYIDVIIFPGPDVDLRIPRALIYAAALGVLLFGLIWDAE